MTDAIRAQLSDEECDAIIAPINGRGSWTYFGTPERGAGYPLLRRLVRAAYAAGLAARVPGQWRCKCGADVMTCAPHGFVAVICDAAERAAGEAPALAHNRDTDWVLAMGASLGLNSGYRVPVVPTKEAFDQLFAAIRAAKWRKSLMARLFLALDGTPTNIRWGPSNEDAGYVPCEIMYDAAPAPGEAPGEAP